MMHGRDIYIILYRSWVVENRSRREREREREGGRGVNGDNTCYFLGCESVQYRNRYNVVNKKHYVSSVPCQRSVIISWREGRDS